MPLCCVILIKTRKFKQCNTRRETLNQLITKKVKRPFKAGISVTGADVNNSIIIQKRHTKGSYAALFLGSQLQDVLLLSGACYCVLANNGFFL